MYACIVLIQAAHHDGDAARRPVQRAGQHGPLSWPRTWPSRISCNTTSAAWCTGLAVPGLNPSLWTLKIEIGFYAIVPLIFLAMRRWQWKALVAIFLASVAYQVIALHMGEPRYARQLPGQMQYLRRRHGAVPVCPQRACAGLGHRRASPRCSCVMDLAAPNPTRHLRRCWSVPSCSALPCARRWCAWAPTCRTASTWCTDRSCRRSLLLGLFTDTPAMLAVVVALVLLLAFVSESAGGASGQRVRPAPVPAAQPGARAGGGQCGVIRADSAARRGGPDAAASNPSSC